MSDKPDSVVQIFNQMVSDGFITPVARMETMRFPGEYMYVPSIVTYGTHATVSRAEVADNAKLEQRS